MFQTQCFDLCFTYQRSHAVTTKTYSVKNPEESFLKRHIFPFNKWHLATAAILAMKQTYPSCLAIQMLMKITFKHVKIHTFLENVRPGLKDLWGLLTMSNFLLLISLIVFFFLVFFRCFLDTSHQMCFNSNQITRH